jgi:hypothetical protein
VRIITLVCLCFCLTFSGCAKAPPTLPPATALLWQANEAAVAIGTVQHTAIELNKIDVCDTATPQKCHRLLSDKNTGIVVDAVTAALVTIRNLPNGWKPTTLAALDQIDAALDEYGKAKLKAYTAAARIAINLIGA